MKAYLTKTPERLERDVKNRLYPPSIGYQFAYTHIPVMGSSLRMVNLIIDGAQSGRVSYPCEVYDSPEGVFQSSAAVCMSMQSICALCVVHNLADHASMPTSTKVPQSGKVQSQEPKAGEPISDVIEAHCYVVDIGRTHREQIRSRINNN